MCPFVVFSVEPEIAKMLEKVVIQKLCVVTNGERPLALVPKEGRKGLAGLEMELGVEDPLHILHSLVRQQERIGQTFAQAPLEYGGLHSFYLSLGRLPSPIVVEVLDNLPENARIHVHYQVAGAVSGTIVAVDEFGEPRFFDARQGVGQDGENGASRIYSNAFDVRRNPEAALHPQNFNVHALLQKLRILVQLCVLRVLRLLCILDLLLQADRYELIKLQKLYL